MKTILEVINLSAAYLMRHGIERARREAEEVIADALGCKRLDLYLEHAKPLEQKELQSLREKLSRRAKGEPASYISGSVQFLDLSIKVTPDVLIPRGETEILVEKIKKKLATFPNLEGKILWDVCCGTGCIGIALKKAFPTVSVTCSDVSERALRIARENGSSHGVKFEKGDLFEPFFGKTCDFFVCNPPYVTEEEYKTLSMEVKNEPKIALVAGATGLEFYRRLADSLPAFLNPGGLGWLELGAGQGENVKSIFENASFTCHYESDWAGHDRFFFLERD